MRSAGAATLLGSSELATCAGPLSLSPSLPNLPPNKSCAMCATAWPCPRRRKRRLGLGGPPCPPGGWVSGRVSGRVCGLGWALGTRARRRKELCEGQWTRLGLRSSYLFSYPCSLSLLSLSPSLPLFLARSLEYVCAQFVSCSVGLSLSLSPSLSFSLFFLSRLRSSRCSCSRPSWGTWPSDLNCHAERCLPLPQLGTEHPCHEFQEVAELSL